MTEQDGVNKVGREASEFLKYVVTNIVDHEDDVRVESEIRETRIITDSGEKGSLLSVIILKLHTHKSDIGQVKGHLDGIKNIIEYLLKAYGGKRGFKIEFNYVTQWKNRKTSDHIDHRRRN